MSTVVPYSDLLAKFDNPDQVPYLDLLTTEEWKSKSLRIRKRDGFKCTQCNRHKTKQFKTKQLSDIFPGDNIQLWNVVGNDLKFRMKLEGGHYWFFSEITLNRSSAYYRGKRFLKLQQGESSFALIKSDKNYHLQVHHKRYILGTLPWEYHDSDLRTVCNWCHWDLHQNEKINIYERLSNGGLVKLTLTPCYRCKGAGSFPQYDHIENGLCFRCEGKRFEELRK